jgi:uncharacterized protein (TIGR03435 family)
MHSVPHRIYRVLLRMHPAAFRNEFGREMELDFEEALYTFGVGRLLVDAGRSLGRQWYAGIFPGLADPASAHGQSLLAGKYAVVRGRSFTSLELGFGVIASVTQLALCVLALSASPGHTAGVHTVYAASITPATDGNGSSKTPAAGGGSDGFEFEPTQGTAASLGFAHTTELKPELLLFHPSGPLTSYEVATVKPIDPDAASSMVKLPPGGSLSPLSIRRYIMNAYGAIYAPQIVGGPAWLNKDASIIHGKVPDDLAAALEKMNRDDRMDQNRMMEQSLLAERFHLKAHFETRVLPVYELVPAKGGLKMAGVPAPPEIKPGDPPARLDPGERLAPGTVMTTPNGNGLRVLNARAIQMQLLARIIGGDIGDRPIVDHTGFTGFFDVTDLTWAPLAEPDASSEPDAPSLGGALKEKLGVSIVRGEDPIEVLVIDDIERPTPN